MILDPKRQCMLYFKFWYYLRNMLTDYNIGCRFRSYSVLSCSDLCSQFILANAGALIIPAIKSCCYNTYVMFNFINDNTSDETVLRLKRIWLDKMGITKIDNLEMLGNVTHIHLDFNLISIVEVNNQKDSLLHPHAFEQSLNKNNQYENLMYWQKNIVTYRSVLQLLSLSKHTWYLFSLSES